MTEVRWPEWRLIKFAPKDGRDVLLCREGERGAFVGWWSAACTAWVDNMRYDLMDPQPTHFVLLPDAKGAPPVGEVA